MKIKVLHLIPNLGSGGAEAMLTKLIRNNRDNNVSMCVVTLFTNNYFYNEISETGTKIYSLNINNGALGLLKLLKLLVILIKEKPDVIQTWMYHCDFIGALLKVLFPRKKLVWNIRHSKLVKNVDKNTTILLAKILSKLSFLPNKIICGSTAAYEYHLELGYKEKKIVVIPNGFDTVHFSPDSNIKEIVREELSILDGNLIIGHVGRAKKIKNQIALIEAFSNISEKYSNINLVLIGNGLREKYDQHNLVMNNNKIYLMDETPNVHKYLKAFDLFVLPSLSEGFPNVIGEAMASGVPCVSTRVGDSAKIINKPELIAERNSPIDLEKKILYWLELNNVEKEELKIYSRNRIINTYSINKIVASYIDIYRKLV